ncbi:MAG: hypothetical protein MJZ19_11190 [Paludibacteraceae bacterium]|nr:hypothetical protein [Paludibacteraceae bacterium]
MEKIQVKRDAYETEILKKRVEEKFGTVMHTPSNFDKLSATILLETKKYLSPTTLKRLWGYIDGAEIIRYSTLDILSLYLGYKNWDDFLNNLENDGCSTSKEYFNATIESKDLRIGDVIQLTWWPNRTVEVEYNGDNNFEVISSVNSKLCVTDTFKCAFFVNGESLLLDYYIHNGMTPTKYLCGKEGGIKAKKL